jgi:hypothetical protein
MATALEAVLNLKADERAREQFKSEQISQAVQLFQNARQNVQENQLKNLMFGMEERKYKSDLKQQVFENALKTKQQESMDKYLSLLGGGNPQAQVGSTIAPTESAMPTLQDAIPVPKQTFIQTPYLSATGKVAVQNRLDPSYNKNLELRNAQIKELEDFAAPLEKLASRLEVLDKAIDETPEFKEGFGSKLVAKGKNALADFNNEKWFRDYDLAFNKTFLPAAQAEGMSKVMSDLDLKTQIQSLGDPTAPRSTKKSALQQIRESLGKYADSKLNAFGANKEVISKIYPNASKEFLGTKLENKIDKNAAIEELKRRGRI